MARPSARRIEAAIAATEQAAALRLPQVCPLCERPIPPQAKSSRHHLVPRLKGGTHKGTVRLHQICHSAIHARFSETELAGLGAAIDAAIDDTPRRRAMAPVDFALDGAANTARIIAAHARRRML